MRRVLALVAVAIGGCGTLLGASDDDDLPPTDGDGGPGDAFVLEATIIDPGGDSGDDATSDAQEADGPVDAGPPLRVFISEGERTGSSLGSDIDTYCQGLANTAGLGGKWVSWLSDTTRNASAVVQGNGPWTTLAGDLVAKDKATLLLGTLAHAIDRDQNNVFRVENVWTGSSAGGGAIQLSHCNNWTANTGQGRLGKAGATNYEWSDWTSSPCALGAHVYCFEVP